MQDERWDVVIVGMGPVGAMLAGLLGVRGLSVLGVERLEEVSTIPRAGHFDHSVLRVVQELGCLDEVLEAAVPNRGLDLVTAGHELLVRLRGDVITPSGLPASIHLHQPILERAIRNRLATMPNVHLALGADVVEVADLGDRARVRYETAMGPAEAQAAYVVGCDGAGSSVRRLAGIALDDHGFEESWVVADLMVDEDSPDFAPDTLGICDPERPRYSIEMGRDRHRLEFMVRPGEDPDELTQPERLRELFTWFADPDRIVIERVAAYRFHALVAKRWRTGRIVIAGDAAHQMPPFLGQGLCAGTRDVHNLAWKLEHVLVRGASDDLLDTYETERRPQVDHVMKAAIEYGRIICTTEPDEVQALHERFLDDERPPDARLGFRLRGVTEGPLALVPEGRLFPQGTVGGRRTDEVVGPRFLVLARDASLLEEEAARWWRDVAGAYVASVDDLEEDAPTLATWLEDRSASVVIVRPDRQVMALTDDLAATTARVGNLLGTPPPRAPVAVPDVSRHPADRDDLVDRDDPQVAR